MAVTFIRSGTLGEVNVGLAASVKLVNPLAAQIDKLLASALNPLLGDLSAQYNASLATQATLSLQIANPLDALQQAISAVAQLQASLTAALALPPVQLEVNAEITAAASIAAALGSRIGALKELLDLVKAIKTPSVSLAAGLTNTLGLGPVFLHMFSGQDLVSSGGAIGSLFSSGLADGATTIAPGDGAFGFVLVTKDAGAFAALSTIFGSL